MNYEAVIGLEVHVQLQTESKIFSSGGTAFGAEPNTQVEPVSLGLPGVLPVLNRRAVEFAIRMGLATNCRIAERSIFARKHYFYPDLPKGYQISQFEEPLCEQGYLDLTSENGQPRRIHIIRIHLEEDAGKSVHAETYVAGDETLVDLNRCGVPLIEIVSGPDIRTPAEAGNYLWKIRQLVRYLAISDGNMAEGSLRCDANVSVRPAGQTALGVKTELKNMNTISGVEKAIEAEVARQIAILSDGGTIVQQTLLWDAASGRIVPMRSKEESHDYRYFPDPDLVPLVVDAHWRRQIEAALPELPDARRQRFEQQLGLPAYDAAVLTNEKEIADYFEAVVRQSGNAKTASNWVMGDVMRVLNEQKLEISSFPIEPVRLGELLRLIDDGTISGKIAKTVFEAMLESNESPAAIIEARGLSQISDSSAIERVIDEVLAAHPAEVARYREGEAKLLGFFVGRVMQASRGKANPQLANEILRKKLT